MKRVYSFRALGVGVATRLIRFGRRRTDESARPPSRGSSRRRSARGWFGFGGVGPARGGARQVGFDRAGGLVGPRGGWCESNVSRPCDVGGRLRAARPERDGWMLPERGRRRVESARRRRICFERARKGNARAGESSNGGRRRTERLAVSFGRSHRPRRPLGVGWDGARGGFVAARPRGPIAHRSPLGAVSPGVCRAEARHRRGSSTPDSEVTSSDALRRAPREL